MPQANAGRELSLSTAAKLASARRYCETSSSDVMSSRHLGDAPRSCNRRFPLRVRLRILASMPALPSPRTLLAVFALACACGDDDSGQVAGDGGSGASAGASTGPTGGSAGQSGAGGAGAGQGAGQSGASGAGSDAGGSDAGLGTDGGASGDGGSQDPGCVAPPPFDQGVAYERTLHVSTGGDDQGGDGSEGSPFATIDRALREATPGPRVLVRII
jgi:hypothetical protein